MKSAAEWHIIKVHETRPKTVPPLAEVRKNVEERALDAKKRGARALWVGRLPAASKIEIDKAAIAAFVKARTSPPANRPRSTSFSKCARRHFAR